ncbi:hypothetical protein Dimus_024830 [Dionaea muscipula]
MKSSKKGVKMSCGRCGELGHNTRICKNPQKAANKVKLHGLEGPARADYKLPVTILRAVRSGRQELMIQILRTKLILHGVERPHETTASQMDSQSQKHSDMPPDIIMNLQSPIQNDPK